MLRQLQGICGRIYSTDDTFRGNGHLGNSLDATLRRRDHFFSRRQRAQPFSSYAVDRCFFPHLTQAGVAWT